MAGQGLYLLGLGLDLIQGRQVSQVLLQGFYPLLLLLVLLTLPLTLLLQAVDVAVTRLHLEGGVEG